ncbi:MAG: hypothetical protein J5565_04935 [Muribaculaceae bacterium]|nr:hypothetical protein [Muribaculaceae bacterium]
MTAIQLNAALHRELSYIVTDDTMMERALKSLRKIRRERKAEQNQEDAARQVAAGLRQAFKEFKQVQEGNLEARPINDLFDELRD